MKLLKTITDKDIVSGYIKPKINIKYVPRKAVRAVLFDNDKKVALLNVSELNYHKLPGGGVKANENDFEALRRECLEEVGCDATIEKEIGMITEYRDQFKQIQHSYCYLAKVKGLKGRPKFTTEEIRQGFKPVWVSGEERPGIDPEWMVIDKAIEILRKDKPGNYEGEFIQKRDLIFLVEAKKYLR